MAQARQQLDATNIDWTMVENNLTLALGLVSVCESRGSCGIDRRLNSTHGFVFDLPPDSCDYVCYKKTDRVVEPFADQVAFGGWFEKLAKGESMGPKEGSREEGTVTHPLLIDERSVPWPEVLAYAGLHGFDFLPEHAGLEGWRRCRVDPRGLLDMHGVFGRGRPDGLNVELEKGQRFEVLFTRYEERIGCEDFPAAADIKREWLDKPAIVVQRTPRTGALYVADGEMRTFNALYHHEPSLDAFVIDVDQEREVIS